MRIGILGSGLMGGKLGTIFARAGHDVVFSYARSGQRAPIRRRWGYHACHFRVIVDVEPPAYVERCLSTRECVGRGWRIGGSRMHELDEHLSTA